ncbi:adenylosuccinate lyase [Candidatus Nanopelagicus hibericus]|uniref:Adenylosuccinate lyase n=1 Tax=Candidatus Nanopelagicus hibericus TaxID=1884915 RepID=A0A249KAL9_9ACTN|nr:adenylosuccinate lyase [Candidatus Nanopelagicus hibericus]ASY13812.1 adenylosuccinate lyase [Candidatus Nanopelagicus hibericus]
MSITPNVLATRYATKEMVAIFDPINKIINERKFWITILKLQQKAGLPITDGDIKAYEQVIEKVELASIDKREIKTRHDVKARIEEFNALSGVEKIHIGLTSRDLTENIEVIQIKAGLELIEYRVLQTLFLLGEKISKYEKTYMVGRSHNVAAQVTTLGKRFASCAEELLFAHTALKELIVRLPLRGIKGPVGTSQDALDAMGKDFTNLEESIADDYGFENTWASVGQIYPRSVDFEVVSKLLQIASAPSSMATTIRLMAGSGLVSEGFKAGQVGSSAMPHKKNSRSSERINGMMVLLRGYNTMASDLAGDQWNEGDVSCSVVRRVVIPDTFYVLDGLLHTFMTILQEFGVFEEKIKAELDEQLPLLATTKLLMECVKAGMGREVAHQIIKKHSTTTAPSELFAAIGSEKEFPLSLEQMNRLIQNPSDFAGLSVEQANKVKDMIKLQINGKLSKVELTDLR